MQPLYTHHTTQSRQLGIHILSALVETEAQKGESLVPNHRHPAGQQQVEVWNPTRPDSTAGLCPPLPIHSRPSLRARCLLCTLTF